MELDKKTILITGASSGIGAAAANLCADQGANVVLGARREAELGAIAEQINNKGNGTAAWLAGDVNDSGYAVALVDLAEVRFGSLDGAFNNAGIIGDMGAVTDMELSNWNNVISTNLTSAFLAAKAQIPAMRKCGGGSIVFTSSFVGFSNAGMSGMAAYAASKAGMIGLTKSLASEHASEGIRVNAVLPGGTKTAMAGDDPDTQDLIANLHPLKRMAEPEEIADAVIFLLSDRASFMTGSPMFVDGGISVRL